MSNGSLSTFPRYVFFLRWSWSFPEILKHLPVQGENFEPSYLKINPAGTVPTLVVGNDTFTDSIVSSHPCSNNFPSMQKAPTPLGAWMDGQIVNVTGRKGNSC